jgi:hypothetical protein
MLVWEMQAEEKTLFQGQKPQDAMTLPRVP